MTEAIETLQYARDIVMSLKFMPERPVRGRVQGLITGLRKHGGIVFVTVRDITDSIQVVLRKNHLAAESWNEISNWNILDSVFAEGPVDRTRSGELSIFAEATGSLTSTVRGINGAPDEDYSNLTLARQFFLAQLRNKASSWMRERGFLEFSPLYLSASTEFEHLEPLEVVFPGWGGKSYLIASPVHQLQSALMAARDRVFCVSRVFSSMVRDGYTSAESQILCLQLFNPQDDELKNLAEGLIKHLFKDLRTMPEAFELPWSVQEWSVLEAESSPSFTGDSYNRPTFETYREFPSELLNGSSQTVIMIMRLMWPPNIVLAEGHIGLIDAVRYGGLTIHLERMIPLLKKDIPLRFLQQTA